LKSGGVEGLSGYVVEQFTTLKGGNCSSYRVVPAIRIEKTSPKHEASRRFLIINI